MCSNSYLHKFTFYYVKQQLICFILFRFIMNTNNLWIWNLKNKWPNARIKFELTKHSNLIMVGSQPMIARQLSKWFGRLASHDVCPNAIGRFNKTIWDSDRVNSPINLNTELPASPFLQHNLFNDNTKLVYY